MHLAIRILSHAHPKRASFFGISLAWINWLVFGDKNTLKCNHWIMVVFPLLWSQQSPNNNGTFFPLSFEWPILLIHHFECVLMRIACTIIIFIFSYNWRFFVNFIFKFRCHCSIINSSKIQILVLLKPNAHVQTINTPIPDWNQYDFVRDLEIGPN